MNENGPPRRGMQSSRWRLVAPSERQFHPEPPPPPPKSRPEHSPDELEPATGRRFQEAVPPNAPRRALATDPIDSASLELGPPISTPVPAPLTRRAAPPAGAVGSTPESSPHSARRLALEDSSVDAAAPPSSAGAALGSVPRDQPAAPPIGPPAQPTILPGGPVPFAGYRPPAPGGTWPSPSPLAEPPSQTWEPTPTPTRRTRRIVARVGLSLVGTAALLLIAMFAVPRVISLSSISGPTATPSSVTTTSAAPSAGPSPTEVTVSGSSETGLGSGPIATMPAEPLKVLRANPIYQLTTPASCPEQDAPESEEAFQSQVKALVKCLNLAWRAALKQTDIDFSKPKIVFYQTSIKSPCQKLGTTFPAAYCPANQTLYFSEASFQQGKYYRLAVAHVVMHEYAHHVQWLASIFKQGEALGEASEVTTRRVELQAHCLAHYQLTHSELGFTNADRVDAEYQFDYTSDAAGHGSTKAERYWGLRGLDGVDLSPCNTWKAKAAKVK